MTVTEAFSQDCQGLVFELPCPENFVADNFVVGNFAVMADPTFGGGNLNVSGNIILFAFSF